MDIWAKMGLQLPPFLQQQQQQHSQPGQSFPRSPADNASAPLNTSAAGPFSPGIMDTLLVSAGQASPLMQLVIFIYRQLGTQLGLDPSLVLTVLGVLWGLFKLGSQAYEFVEGLFDRYFLCAMYVSEYDHIYVQLMKWLSHQNSIRSSRFLMAQTVWKSAWEEEDDLEHALSWTDGDAGDGEPKYLNFSNQAARSSPRYVPAMGVTSFWHKGTYFRVYRKKESLVNTSGWGGTKDLEEIKISCSGRSMEPIKRLLAEAKAFYYQDTYRKTTIYRPKPKEQRHDSSMWQQVARRPVRPMSTVVLDSHEKHSVLADVNDYLHPRTPRWYASRGIPLRRGYLFHGPPGTGKTSFSFALAGVFGIDIYVISLQDLNVTEEDLATLFTRLPRRCIVLLEDIDTAGLRRDTDDTETEDADDDDNEAPLTNGGRKGNGQAKQGKDKKKKKKTTKKSKKEEEKKEDGGESNSNDDDDTDDSTSSDSDSDSDSKSKKKSSALSSSRKSRSQKARKSRRRKAGGGSSSSHKANGKAKVGLDSISLSGLLNAIDGVASHEGRILIMTTNKPESLDEALIRPGRVDVQVAFMNASSTQAAELFRRMYEASRPRRKEIAGLLPQPPPPVLPPSPSSPGHQDKTSETKAAVPGDELDVSGEEELVAIADEFGRRIPGDMFSPAEIQGFLLKRKHRPRKALEDVEGWIAASMKQKEANSKVSTVQ
ncbi:ATPase family associated with various cellular activities (AAA) domain-containing protein [Hirsutella rhossiliensis]|uniref:ATPase family associated with various cellular activities (AAA) domain-containing protein n=1 Tax=Hirsutella rhossiliensis TaxID=111463 RepID=A0A9P8N6P9_9HYPO|nr:ATPase family associated with various cellular activities (AAA) domain-containing protein [Hirsutella rhossiliensis]KAH0967950.1 ATPase family associated with various cellular activities (AAA) domain-containing protein [Hirsutella rhossiliensis]